MAYPEGLLRPGERVLTHLRPHWRMLVLPVVAPPLAVGVGAWAAAAVLRLGWSDGHRPLQIAVLVVVVGLVGWFSVAPVLRWRCTHFVLTDRRLLVREGVVSRVGIDVPAASVTAVRTRQTRLERLLRCGTLVVPVEGADDPWEFEGLGDLPRTAALLEQVAEDRGGLAGDDVRPEASGRADLVAGDPDDLLSDPGPRGRGVPRRRRRTARAGRDGR